MPQQKMKIFYNNALLVSIFVIDNTYISVYNMAIAVRDSLDYDGSL